MLMRGSSKFRQMVWVCGGMGAGVKSPGPKFWLFFYNCTYALVISIFTEGVCTSIHKKTYAQYTKRVTIGLSAIRHFNGVSLAGQ